MAGRLRAGVAAYGGFDRTVYAVVLARLVNVLGAGMVFPFATLYFHLELGLPLGLVGAGLLANSVATAAGTAAGGYLADRYGRKPVMVGSMATSSVTLAAYALVGTVPEFVLVATAAGLTAGLYAPASQAMIADLTASDERERAFGLLKVASNAGMGVGFVLGGLLYAVAEAGVFVADGATSAVVALLLVAVLPRVHDPEADAPVDDSTRAALAGWWAAITRRRLLELAALNVGFAVAYAQLQATVPVFASTTLGLTSEQIGTVYILNPLVIVLFQLPVVAGVRGWRRTRGLALSAGFWGVSFVAVAAAGLAGLPWALGVGLVAAFVVLRTVGEILHAPLVTALASDVTGREGRSAGLSLLEVAKRAGWGLGSVAGGLFFDLGVQHLLWPALVGVCLLVALGVLRFERRVSPTENGVVSS